MNQTQSTAGASSASDLHVPPKSLELALPIGAVNSAQVQALQVQPQPFRVDVETSTDWPVVLATLAVGVGSILTSLVVGWLSVVNQRTQVRSSIANFRHAWIQELREQFSRFISLSAKISYEITHDAKYLISEKSNQPFGDLMESQAHILLMLDQKKSYCGELNTIMNDMVDALRVYDQKKLSTRTQDLANRANEVLEIGWQDIKSDLRNDRKGSHEPKT